MVKPGFHYPSWRPELTARLVETRARQHGSCWRVMETGHPSTRAVNSGTGNQALLPSVAAAAENCNLRPRKHDIRRSYNALRVSLIKSNQI